jgi:hypothetical protein
MSYVICNSQGTRGLGGRLTHTHTCVCMHACMYVCVCVFMHVCVYVCMYACMYVCMHAYTPMSYVICHMSF